MLVLMLLAMYLVPVDAQPAWGARVTDVQYPERLAPNQPDMVRVTIEYYGLGAGYRYYATLQVTVFDIDSANYLARFVDPTAYGFGVKTYDIAITSPASEKMWHLSAQALIAVTALGGAGLYHDPYDWYKNFDINISESARVVVAVGEAGVPIDLAGESMTSNSSGIVYAEIEYGKHRISAPPVVDIDKGTRLLFEGWSDGETQSDRMVSVTGDLQLGVIYKTQYYLRVVSEYGTPHGEGWYDIGSTASYWIEPETIDKSGVTYMFESWKGDSQAQTPSSSLTMDSPKTVTAEWSTKTTLDTSWIVLTILILFSVIATAVIVQRRKANQRSQEPS